MHNRSMHYSKDSYIKMKHALTAHAELYKYTGLVYIIIIIHETKLIPSSFAKSGDSYSCVECSSSFKCMDCFFTTSTI